MGFDDLIGHERPIRLLKATLKSGRMPHALLLTGPPGVGKRTLALAVAQAVNCLDPREGAPCGVCKACDKIARGVHPDVEELQLEGRAKVITVDAVRDVRSRISYRPFEGSCKVFILPGAERMQEAAANALLKTLEEPPPRSLLILTAPEEAGLLGTIVSRCLRLNLAPLSFERVERWLTEHRSLSGPRARLLGLMSGGCIGQVEGLDADDIWEKRGRLVEAFRALDPDRPAGAIEWAGEMAGDADSWPIYLNLLRFWYRDLMMITGGGRRIVNEDLTGELERAAAGLGPEPFIAALEAVDRAEDALNRFIRPELVFENLVLSLSEKGNHVGR